MAAFTVALTLSWFLMITLSREAVTLWRRRIGLLLLVPLLALLLTAVLLVPLVEALPYLNRAALTVDDAGLFSLPWSHLLTMFIPTYGGTAEQLVYLGIPLASLALFGLLSRRDAAAWLLGLTAVGAALFALGTHTPLFPTLFGLLPGLGWLRVPPRAWMLVAFCAALLAGRGLDALLEPHPSPTLRRRATLVGLIILTVELVLAGGLLFLYQPTPPAVWALVALAVLTATALLLRARGRLRPGLFAATFLLLTATDLALVRTAWTEMRPPAEAFAWGAPAAEYLARQSGRFRSYSPSYSVPQHTASQHDLFLADGVDPIQLTHYADFLASAGGYEVTGYSPSLPPVLDDTSAQPDAARLGLLAVSYVASGFPIEVDGLVLRAHLGDTYLYRNERAVSPAFVIPRAQRPESFDIRLETPIEPRPARLVLYSPNLIVVKVDLETPGLLVLSEVWFPGWRALANGVQVPMYRVEGTLRGVYLDDGAHTVEFRYSPWTVWVGLSVSCLAALTAFGGAAYQSWRQP
jgi:hypothetical protein